MAIRLMDIRSDVPPPAGYKPIFAYKVINDYRRSSSIRRGSRICANVSRNIPDRSSTPAACVKEVAREG